MPESKQSIATRRALGKYFEDRNLPYPHRDVARKIINSFTNWIEEENITVSEANLPALASRFLVEVWGVNHKSDLV